MFVFFPELKYQIYLHTTSKQEVYTRYKQTAHCNANQTKILKKKKKKQKTKQLTPAEEGADNGRLLSWIFSPFLLQIHFFQARPGLIVNTNKSNLEISCYKLN